ncbi:hypothetical protein FRX31_011206, partial [Thalictrum thalictroides]
NSKRIEDEHSSLKKAKRFSEEHSFGSSGRDKMKVKFGFVIKGIFQVCSLRDLNCIFETSEKNRKSKRIEDESSSLKKAKRFSEEHSSGSSGSELKEFFKYVHCVI